MGLIFWRGECKRVRDINGSGDIFCLHTHTELPQQDVSCSLVGSTLVGTDRSPRRVDLDVTTEAIDSVECATTTDAVPQAACSFGTRTF